MNRLRFAFLVLAWAEVSLALGSEGPGVSGNHFQFRLPQPAGYRIDVSETSRLSANSSGAWLKAYPDHSRTNFVEFGSRLVLRLEPHTQLAELVAQQPLALSRTVDANVFILQAPDALTAMRQAQRLAAIPGVVASYPVIRQQADLHAPYAVQPSDTLFGLQWELEHRNADGSSAGVDLNVRAAWPFTTGAGVTIAIVDIGVEMNHPELVARVAGAPHYNFVDQSTNGAPISRSAGGAHGTEAAGLAAATRDNERMVGVAPDASLASWVVLTTNFTLASDELLMDAYQYQSNLVSVQNLSWGHTGLTQSGLTPLEDIGISNAVCQGRSGRGIVIVRSAGNDRASGGNADDDGYPSDPRAIAVAAVRIDGRVASYSEPGACVLVAAPSGDAASGFNGLLSTDLLGTDGVTQFHFFPPNEDLNNYVFNNLGFSGTSAAAPQIAGVVALLLAANTNLTFRDVQQILILSARQFDFADPDLATNGAGFLVSHNTGFGVPDAGLAVQLARHWHNRPPSTTITFEATNSAAIPDDGLRVRISGQGVPALLSSIHCLPSVGPHADSPTPLLRLVDFGFGTNRAGYNLTNQGALIQRGGATFAAKINLAAQAGAQFAVVYNMLTNTDTNDAPGGDSLMPMGATDFVPIPAVFIGHSDGEALKALFQTNRDALAQIQLNATSYVFSVTNTLLCEHVGVRLRTDHSLRGDVRVTLLSPAGTRSILQRYNADETPGPTDWTYYTTHDFFESSAGQWAVFVSDEGAGNTGSVQSVSLIIHGVPMVDTDHDGLDDRWEMKYLGTLDSGPAEDPDRDGCSNAREQLMGTDPTVPDHFPFALDLSCWSPTLDRLSWPSSPLWRYEIWSGATPDSLVLRTNLPGRFSETEWFVPRAAGSNQFYRVRAVP